MMFQSLGYVSNGASEVGDPTMALFRKFSKALEEAKQFFATHALHVPLQADKDVQAMENSLRWAVDCAPIYLVTLSETHTVLYCY